QIFLVRKLRLIVEKRNRCCFSIMAMPNLIIILITIFIIFILRILSVIHQSKIPLHNSPPKAVSSLIILGSGGHSTAEIINLIPVLQRDRFTLRVYVVASTDNMSLQKAQVSEASMVDQVLGIRWSSIFNVESIARVKRLSLSGLLLYKLHIR
ncbi:hypothetical protein C5167_009809, partial [Papaver somniferum]